MALSFDDRILGEKVENYCSSSEEEDNNDEEVELNEADEEAANRDKYMKDKQVKAPPPNLSNKHQTGPKGVLEDWKQYKELAFLKKLEDQLEKSNLYQSIAGNCKTNQEISQMNKEDEEFKELLEGIEGAEEILAEYREKRMNEMRSLYMNLPTFDTVYDLTIENFSSTIDNENKLVSIIIHLYEPNVKACDNMKGCLTCLAQEYPNTKFCQMRASSANMSQKFIDQALPALIIYKAGELIGNLIQIDRYLGEDFFADQLEDFLKERGFIPDKATDLSCKLSTVRVLDRSNNTNDYNID